MVSLFQGAGLEGVHYICFETTPVRRAITYQHYTLVQLVCSTTVTLY